MSSRSYWDEDLNATVTTTTEAGPEKTQVIPLDNPPTKVRLSVIVGAVIGSVLAALILGVAIWAYFRRRYIVRRVNGPTGAHWVDGDGDTFVIEEDPILESFEGIAPTPQPAPVLRKGGLSDESEAAGEAVPEHVAITKVMHASGSSTSSPSRPGENSPAAHEEPMITRRPAVQVVQEADGGTLEPDVEREVVPLSTIRIGRHAGREGRAGSLWLGIRPEATTTKLEGEDLEEGTDVDKSNTDGEPPE